MNRVLKISRVAKLIGDVRGRLCADVRSRGQRIAALDSIRIVLAIVVACSHGCGPDFRLFMDEEVAMGTLVGNAYWLISGNLYNGQAAVIVFFIISGLCIHFPYAGGRKFDVVSFLVGRYIRIGIPLVIVLAAANLLFGVRPAHYTGLWSLICELIYYSIYPLLRTLRNMVGSRVIVYVLSLFAVVGLLILGDLPAASQAGRLQDFAAYGPGVTWIVGLPVWILGCGLAELGWTRNGGLRRQLSLWGVRLAVLAASILLNILKFHGDRILGFDLPNYVSLHAFSLGALLWLWYETTWYSTRKPSVALEWGGKWSYSLYIGHPLLGYAVHGQILGQGLGAQGLLDGVLRLCAICALAYGLYVLVEKPSHQLARLASRGSRRLPAT